MSKTEIIHTKYGNAGLYGKKKYYIISSVKEGNHGKYLHVLIWEDHYGIKKPEGCDIHHIDGDSKNNSIQNLICVPSKIHQSFHSKGNDYCLGRKHTPETKKKISNALKGENHPFYGKHHSEETRKKISEAHKGKIIPEEEKQRLRTLCLGKVHSEETKTKISKALKEHKRTEEHCINLSKSRNKTGYYNVSFCKTKSVKQGWGYRYQYHDENGKQKSIFSTDIKKLEKKVKSKGLKWIKFEEE